MLNEDLNPSLFPVPALCSSALLRRKSAVVISEANAMETYRVLHMASRFDAKPLNGILRRTFDTT